MSRGLSTNFNFTSHIRFSEKTYNLTGEYASLLSTRVNTFFLGSVLYRLDESHHPHSQRQVSLHNNLKRDWVTAEVGIS